VQPGRVGPPHGFPDTLSLSLSQPPPTGDGTAVVSGQVLPATTGAVHGENAVEGSAIIGSGSAAAAGGEAEVGSLPTEHLSDHGTWLAAGSR
jgi:hypothetical protein